MKVCSKCGIGQPLTNFTPRKDRGPNAVVSKCKACMRAASAAYKALNRDEVRRKNAKRMVRYREENKDAVLAAAARYRDANREKIRAYYHDNREGERARNRRYRQANPHKPAEWVASRKAAKLQQTPAWSERELIRLVYAYAKWLESVVGLPCQVDHIVPLRGDLASGLHCAENLRVITRSENASKKNRVCPDSHSIPSALDDAGFWGFVADERTEIPVDK